MAHPTTIDQSVVDLIEDSETVNHRGRMVPIVAAKALLLAIECPTSSLVRAALSSEGIRRKNMLRYNRKYRKNAK